MPTEIATSQPTEDKAGISNHASIVLNRYKQNKDKSDALPEPVAESRPRNRLDELMGKPKPLVTAQAKPTHDADIDGDVVQVEGKTKDGRRRITLLQGGYDHVSCD